MTFGSLLDIAAGMIIYTAWFETTTVVTAEIKRSGIMFLFSPDVTIYATIRF